MQTLSEALNILIIYGQSHSTKHKSNQFCLIKNTVWVELRMNCTTRSYWGGGGGVLPPLTLSTSPPKLCGTKKVKKNMGGKYEKKKKKRRGGGGGGGQLTIQMVSCRRLYNG